MRIALAIRNILLLEHTCGSTKIEFALGLNVVFFTSNDVSSRSTAFVGRSSIICDQPPSKKVLNSQLYMSGECGSTHQIVKQ